MALDLYHKVRIFTISDVAFHIRMIRSSSDDPRLCMTLKAYESFICLCISIHPDYNMSQILNYSRDLWARLRPAHRQKFMSPLSGKYMGWDLIVSYLNTDISILSLRRLQIDAQSIGENTNTNDDETNQ
ncbi:hypothetical protein GQX74_003385 [Glossina fuscipes]|nr:hypothetical protein GQX74_003385 [Glossina fuscipes]